MQAKRAETLVILVIEADDGVRALVSQLVENLGFKVLNAANGSEGVQVFREYANDIAAILLDLTMPGMNGGETFLLLQQINKDVPVILSSGHDREEALKRFGEKGLAGFLGKPFSIDDLATKLHQVVHA